MKTFFRISAFAFVLLNLASCVVEDKIVFDKNYGGQTEVRMDMGMMIDMISSFDTTKTKSDSMKRNFGASFKKGLDSAAAKNDKTAALFKKMSFEYDSTTTSLYTRFKFDNLTALNTYQEDIRKMDTASQNKEKLVPYQWLKKKKQLLMPGFGQDLLKTMLQNDTTGMASGFGSQMQYSLSRTFPKKVKKVSDERFKISQDGKTITFQSSMQDLSQKPLKEITVSF
jgi:hypothetical protein